MKRPRSIRTNMVLSLLTLIGIAFIAVFVVFNISVQQYIDANAKAVIEEAHEGIGLDRRDDPPHKELGPEVRGWNESRYRNRNALGAQVQVFLLEGSQVYGGLFADVSVEEELVAQADLMQALEEVQTVTIPEGTFLVSAAVNPGTGGWLVFYADITQLHTLVGNINLLLFLILAAVGAAAVAVAYRLAASIARPIEQISKFATEIGNNDYTPSTLAFREKETSDLLRVMNSTAARLQAYDSEQRTFFQNVSHELKTPLMTIRCNAEGILFHVMNPETSAQTVMDETDRLVDMIDELIFVSRLDALTNDEVLELRDLREILSNSAEGQHDAADKNNVRFTYDFDDAPVAALVSEKNIERAFSNLISNAVRYASGEVALSCRNEQGRPVIRVWNDGPPIDEKDLPHIFERFYKGKGGLSGIGLSIVKSVAEKLGGTVEVLSDESGTCFIMRLPAGDGRDAKETA